MPLARNAPPSRPTVPTWLVLGALLAAGGAQAATPGSTPAPGSDILHELNRAMIRVAEQVAPSVVQIQVTGFHPAGDGRRVEPAAVARQHAVGSGVIVDPEGYILTNSHVVHGAQRIQVILPTSSSGQMAREDGSRRLVDAKVIGTEPNIDLALLKIEASGLKALSLAAGAPVRQGEMVFAVGSPEGLERSVTTGVVSAVAREVALTQPMAFIQTDAPINPGNSGGPLVNVDGALVGINTFIVTESGGSQGLGFAIPVSMARLVAERLRQDGHVRLVEAGLTTQAITPVLAAGLGLPRDWGVVVADAALGGPGRAAGVAAGDVIVEVDGRSIDSLGALTVARYLHPVGQPIQLVVLRGAQRLALRVEAKEKAQVPDLADLASPEESLVPRLGILGVDVGPRLKGVIPALLEGSGVVVAARTLDATSVESGLQPGDVIHALNRTHIDSVEGLRRALKGLKAGDPVALQVERQSRFLYLAFDME